MWVRTVEGNWFPGKINSQTTRKGITRQVCGSRAHFINLKYLSLTIEGRAILSCSLLRRQSEKVFCTSQRGDQARHTLSATPPQTWWLDR